MADFWEQTREVEPKRENDYRTRFQRDYARLIHSAAFRRLQNKTQILGLGESDFYRTRLTHSLEVMQIGEGLVKCLKHTHQGHAGLEYFPPIELIQSICLAHDIGHPPFGHGGEVALNYCMRSFGGFEGNGQTLRILSRLEKYTQNFGLNPNRRLLLGILKYPAPYSLAVKEEIYGAYSVSTLDFKASEQKPPKCYLDTEHDVVEWIFAPISDADKNRFCSLVDSDKNKHRKTQFKSFDTSIMDLADDISYGVHDLEDGIALQLISKEEWIKQTESLQGKYKSICVEIASDLFSSHAYERKKAIGKLVNIFMTSAIISENNFENNILNYNIKHATEEKIFLEKLKYIVNENVIQNTNVQFLEYKGQIVITTLFKTIFSDPKRFLHNEFKDKFTQSKSNSEQARVVCDYISGMTDPYAAKLYLKITQPGFGSIFERL